MRRGEWYGGDRGEPTDSEGRDFDVGKKPRQLLGERGAMQRGGEALDVVGPLPQAEIAGGGREVTKPLPSPDSPQSMRWQPGCDQDEGQKIMTSRSSRTRTARDRVGLRAGLIDRPRDAARFCRLHRPSVFLSDLR